MVLLSQLTAVVAGLSTVASAVPMIDRRHKAFTVNQIVKHTEKRKSVNLPGMYARTLAKYGAKVPDHVLAAAAQGSAVTTPEQYDEEYLTPVQVGSTTLNLDIDTGSADLWVFSSELPSSERTGHSLYSPSSSAQQLSGYSWQISYGDGSSASGNVYKDVVTVGGVTAQSQAVEAAEQVSSEFVQDTDNDGLMGLAFSSLNTVEPQQQTTFFDTVKSQLNQPVFAACLKHNAPGTYDFGFIDSSKYTGSLQYTDVDNSLGYWMFTANGYAVGDASVTSSSIQGIADTGTTLLLLPSTVVRNYYKKVSGSQNSASVGGYIFPCSASLPDLTIRIGSYNAVIPSAHLNYAPISEGSSTCYGGLQSNSGIGFSIFGDVFLKSQYVVFDPENLQLGFAEQA